MAVRPTRAQRSSETMFLFRGRRASSERGAAAVEFALVVLPLLVVIFGIADFSWVFNQQVSISNAAREAARYYAVHEHSGGRRLRRSPGARTPHRRSTRRPGLRARRSSPSSRVAMPRRTGTGRRSPERSLRRSRSRSPR
ncbi:TadE/TadG family type IV pilus assembly protein [Agromyces sp. MMS24-K17]|uniref:TadE/TadG family type IV pilus assembly protein n=1 Tax=Agromyces sp. MMS24-K17 TaxID=3372850 RepID=UPI0037552CA4